MSCAGSADFPRPCLRMLMSLPCRVSIGTSPCVGVVVTVPFTEITCTVGPGVGTNLAVDVAVRSQVRSVAANGCSGRPGCRRCAEGCARFCPGVAHEGDIRLRAAQHSVSQPGQDRGRLHHNHRQQLWPARPSEPRSCDVWKRDRQRIALRVGVGSAHSHNGSHADQVQVCGRHRLGQARAGVCQGPRHWHQRCGDSSSPLLIPRALVVGRKPLLPEADSFCASPPQEMGCSATPPPRSRLSLTAASWATELGTR